MHPWSRLNQLSAGQMQPSEEHAAAQSQKFGLDDVLKRAHAVDDEWVHQRARLPSHGARAPGGVICIQHRLDRLQQQVWCPAAAVAVFSTSLQPDGAVCKLACA